MKKGIILFIFVAGIVALGGFGSLMVLSDKKQVSEQVTVKGEHTSAGSSKSEVEKKLDVVKAQISSLTTQDLASSGSALQKAISELQSLAQKPNGAIKQQCENICKSL